MSNDIIEGTIISFNAKKMQPFGKRNCVLLFKQRGSELQKSLEFKYWGPYISDIFPGEEFRLFLKDNVPQKIFIVSRNKEIKLQSTSYKIQNIILAFIWMTACCLWILYLYGSQELKNLRFKNCIKLTIEIEAAYSRRDISYAHYLQREYERNCKQY